MRFVLIHGGFHGAWCWERTTPELTRLGHEAIAIDMPGAGARRDEPSTLEAERDAIVEVLEPGDVLVGHSRGGFDITIAADAAPDVVGHLIYLAAALPIEGHSVLEATGGVAERRADGTTEVRQVMTNETGMLEHLSRDEQGRLVWADFQGAWDFFYHDCDEVTARWAFERLTPASMGGWALEPLSVARFWAADLPRSYIHCLQDRAQPAAMSANVAHRLGVEPLTIDTSHSPFLSRPAELAELLVAATATTPIGPLRPGV